MYGTMLQAISLFRKLLTQIPNRLPLAPLSISVLISLLPQPTNLVPQLNWPWPVYRLCLCLPSALFIRHVSAFHMNWPWTVSTMPLPNVYSAFYLHWPRPVDHVFAFPLDWSFPLLHRGLTYVRGSRIVFGVKKSSFWFSVFPEQGLVARRLQSDLGGRSLYPCPHSFLTEALNLMPAAWTNTLAANHISACCMYYGQYCCLLHRRSFHCCWPHLPATRTDALLCVPLHY